MDQVVDSMIAVAPRLASVDRSKIVNAINATCNLYRQQGEFAAHAAAMQGLTNGTGDASDEALALARLEIDYCKANP